MADHFLLSVLRRSQGSAVPFLIIGGHAVIALGHVRATFDYDFLTSESHRQALNAIFEEMGYTLFAANGPFVQWTAPRGLPPVDIMVVDDATFGKLMATSRSIAIAGQEVRIPSPENMVALKLHASRQRTLESASHQDWLDITQIVRRQKLDVEEPAFRTLRSRDRHGLSIRVVHRKVAIACKPGVRRVVFGITRRQEFRQREVIQFLQNRLGIQRRLAANVRHDRPATMRISPGRRARTLSQARCQKKQLGRIERAEQRATARSQ